MNLDFNKYEAFIRVGQNGTDLGNHTYTCNDLENFPTPSSLGTTYHDLDKDAYTDLKGYTHRNRVRHDVLEIVLGYNALSENDLQYILNRISPVWIYVEIIEKKTQQRSIHKMYASDKTWNTLRAYYDTTSQRFREIHNDFEVTLVEE